MTYFPANCNTQVKGAEEVGFVEGEAKPRSFSNAATQGETGLSSPIFSPFKKLFKNFNKVRRKQDLLAMLGGTELFSLFTFLKTLKNFNFNKVRRNQDLLAMLGRKLDFFLLFFNLFHLSSTR